MRPDGPRSGTDKSNVQKRHFCDHADEGSVRQIPSKELHNLPGLTQLLGDAVGCGTVVTETAPLTRPSAAVKIDAAIGTVTTQRLSLRAQVEGLALCTWPAELKPQATAMYQAGRVSRLVKFIAEDQQPWQASPNVHLAYWSAPAHNRLYLKHHCETTEYLHRWLGDDFAHVRAHPRDRIWDDLWPWLLRRDYADHSDKSRLTDFIPLLGNRPALLRPGIALKRLWPWEEVEELNRNGHLVSEIRSAIADVLTALDEPLPPGFARPAWASPDTRPAAKEPVTREAFEDVLIDRAAWTHARLSAGRQHGVELHEETITQDLLLDISIALPGLSVQTYTTQQEAANGADWQWEWWFGGRQWFGLRVQAKRLQRLRSGQLGYNLGYASGSKGRKRRQIDLLIEDAADAGMPAAYVLYNGPDLNMTDITWGCHRLPARAAFFGVSLIPAAVALELLNAGGDDLSTVGSASRPWSCLASCDRSGCISEADLGAWPLASMNEWSRDLSWLTAASYYRIEHQARRALQATIYGDEYYKFYQRAVSGMHDTAPPYVNAVIRGERADLQLPPRVGAVTVFRTSG